MSLENGNPPEEVGFQTTLKNLKREERELSQAMQAIADVPEKEREWADLFWRKRSIEIGITWFQEIISPDGPAPLSEGSRKLAESPDPDRR